jgi:putative transcriptional regulator
MNSLKGHLLIASPSLLAPIFARSVVLLLDHDEAGAMGVILNGPTGTTMTELAGKLFEEDFTWDKPLLLGGPVPGTLIVLHDLADMADLEVIPGVYASLEATKAQEVVSRKTEPSLVVGNHAAWGPGQLEGEFGRGSWLTLPATPEFVFWRADEDLWKVTIQQVSARRLSEILGLRGMPSDPRVN